MERLRYSVELTLPPAALDVRDRLDRALHDSDRHIGVVTGGLERGMRLIILTIADDPDAAQAHALELVTAALHRLGLPGLAEEIEVGEVIGRPILPGGPRLVGAAPALDYRTTTLPGGRVLRAASAGPLDEWFAQLEGEPERVMAGRDLREVLFELLELPRGEREPWFGSALEELAGYDTPIGVRYPCPCCEFLTLVEAPSGTYDTCAVCFWEDDNVQLRDPDYEGGANRPSLNQARRSYRLHGVSEVRFREHVRAPLPAERPQ